MSAISDYVAKQTALNARQDQAIDGVVADVNALNAKIAELQSTQGQITPEDQALLDEIEVRSNTITEKLEALDALHNPTPPPVPA